MPSKKISTLIWVIVLVTVIAIAIGFRDRILPLIESPAVSGLVGVLVGAFVSMFGSIWRASKESEEKLKDRISIHALQLTQMDYDLRQKSLELTGQAQQFLAPAKVYRTFYRSLLELQTTGEWPKDAEELGLLNIFVLGHKGVPNQQVE
jgi:hypothetical protein